EGRELRTLCCYSFASDLYRIALLKYGMTSAERRSVSKKLGNALIALYKPQEEQVAKAIARLLREGGNREDATAYQRMADYGAKREAVREHALYLMSVDKKEWNESLCWQAAGLFLQAGLLMLGSYPHEEVLAVFDEAYNMARRAGKRPEQARAL